MPDYTKNYNLKKPLQNEYYNVDDSNENFDIVDTELKKSEDKIIDLEDELSSHPSEGASYADFRLEFNQSIPHGFSYTKVMLNNVFSDADFVSLENGGARILKDGLYLIAFYAYFESNASGRRGLSFNGAPSVIVEPVSQQDGQTRTFISGFNYYEKGDIINFSVEQTSGNALSVIGSNTTRALISKLG